MPACLLAAFLLHLLPADFRLRLLACLPAWCCLLACLQGGKTQRTFSGSGADEDIVVSSARAYVRCVDAAVGVVLAAGVAMIGCTQRQLCPLSACVGLLCNASLAAMPRLVCLVPLRLHGRVPSQRAPKRSFALALYCLPLQRPEQDDWLHQHKVGLCSSGGSSAATDSMDSGVNSVAAQQPVASSA